MPFRHSLMPTPPHKSRMAEGAEMIMHSTPWRRGRLGAACCAAPTALTTPRPSRDIELVTDGTTVIRVALVIEAAAVLGMLTGLRVARSPFFTMLPSRYRPTAANRVPRRVVAVTAPGRPGARPDGEGKTSP
jgi:hypothetical protein